jgi:hypothetical protein
MRNAYTILVEKPEVNGPLDNPKHTLEDTKETVR